MLAPEAILLPTDFDAYRRYSRLFKAAVAEIAPQIEDRGIDEIYIDLTTARLPLDDTAGDSAQEPETEMDAWWRARDVAKAIKAAVGCATGLTCSIAVAPNKLLAKIASELDKPDGLTTLHPQDIPVRIWPLPVRRINGIGPKADAKLAAIGVRTIGELAHADPQMLVAHFGANSGRWLHDAAHGRDERDVVTESETKSISRETTFERDLHATRNRSELSAIFTELCVGVARRPRAEGLRCQDHRREIALRRFSASSPAITRFPSQRRMPQSSGARLANA